MLMEGDENDDGTIDYNEFLPIGVEIVQSIYARKEAQASKQAMEAEVENAARTALLHGMTQQQYSELLLTYFQAHAGESGVLSRSQFKAALQNAELGLTRQEINVIMSEVDVNDDGVIDLKEFDEVFFEMLVECISQVLSDEMRTADELTTYLLEFFRGADMSSQGLLYKSDITDLLQRGNFGLTKIQVLAVMSEAEIDENGFVDYEKLAPLAASMIRSIWDQNADLDRAVYLDSQARGDTIFGQDRQEVHDLVRDAFLEFDADRSGNLDKAEFKECLMKTQLLGRTLTDKEFNSVLSAVDEDQDGKVSYEEFLNLVLEVMQYFWEEQEYAAHRTAAGQ
jgi:Ca2+-binding EF-hand superfamily protein